MSPSLGFAHDHPDAIASQTSDRHWSMALLMEGVPARVAPARYLDPDIPPNALDQDGLGACVAFAACTIRDAQEHAEWGKWLYATGSFVAPKSGAYLAYDWLKHGHGTYPGDGIASEGSYPEQAWKLAKAEGLPDGKNAPHKISAYYSHSLASDADLTFLQGVLMEYGPVNVATPWGWATSMAGAPKGPSYLMPRPGPIVGGHSYTIVGWETYAGVVHLTCMNSWGAWGSPQGLFRFPASWLYAAPLGPQIVWKTVDAEDAPVASLAIVDKVARLLDTALGAQIYRTDGSTPLAKVSSGELGIASSAALSGNHYAVIVSVGGVLQLGALKAADCTNVRPAGADPGAEKAARKAGADAVAKAAADEAILQGG